MVAKGVSPPSLGSWLLICLFSTKSAAYLAALLDFRALHVFNSAAAPLFDFAQALSKTNNGKTRVPFPFR